MSECLQVFHDRSRVGALEQGAGGAWSFTYALAWQQDPAGFSISLCLPRELERHEGPEVRAFFGGLLPEGRPREAVARSLGLSFGNEFGLLRALGAECAGALSLWPEDPGGPPEPGAAEPILLETERLIEAHEEQTVLALAGAEGRLRLSLAGAQDKLPVRISSERALLLPPPGEASTHILKIPNRDFAHLVENEVLITRLAARLGLEVVSSELYALAGRAFLLIERYDRRQVEGKIVRLHQEDLCQALGLGASRKYEQEGGPSARAAMELLRRHSAHPLEDSLQLLRWLIFGLLARNADGHGKNLSLLRQSDGLLDLAPFYDLVCTAIYPRLDRNLAMGLGGRRDPGQIDRGCWVQLATELDIGVKLLLREVEAMAEALPEAFDALRAASPGRLADSPAADRIQTVVSKQCRRTLRLLDG